ncbi:MAG TPA: hypothetical protein VN631_05750, partial [Negativicutes bacterium]|nr:hypothetical protein [Negativicutes bacterium]
MVLLMQRFSNTVYMDGICPAANRLYHANPTKNDHEDMANLVFRHEADDGACFLCWYNQMVALCSQAYVFTCREKCDILGYMYNPNL